MDLKEQEQELLKRVHENYSAEDEALITRALQFAHSMHDGQTRDSGEPYLIHPIAVASILMDYNLDAPTICAGLMHDCLEDTPAKFSELKKEFGAEIAELVNGVSRVKSLRYKSTTSSENIESLRKMFLAMAKDIRVIFIKLADRLHNMRTLGAVSKDRQIRKAMDTFDIYVPIAERLGLSTIKGEMEDLCFMYLHPTEYEEVTNKLNETYAKRQKDLDKVNAELKQMLVDLGIDGIVASRYKRKYSIYKKYIAKGIEQIFDILAHRVIVDTVKDCYVVLGEVHNRWKPVPGRIKDYIAAPKPNGYQSLHTTLLTDEGIPFEIQIRTKEMHKVCEYGIAAHWKYKHKNEKTTDFDTKLNFLRQLMEENRETADSSEFISMAKSDFYSSEIFVFTPKYKVIQLPEKSTPIDFAYCIHSDLGNKCVGAKVNGKMVPLSTKLATGDIVEIITSQASKGPSRDWLKICQTSSARNRIRNFFKHTMKEENIKIGKELLELEARRRNTTIETLTADPKVVSGLLAKLSYSDYEELCAGVGYGGLSAVKIITTLLSLIKQEDSIKLKQKALSTHSQSSPSILVKGASDVLVRLAHCCDPIPGDNIIGFVSHGKGITVHRIDCPNIRNAEAERLIKVSWNDKPNAEGKQPTYNVTICIMATDRANLLTDITNIIGSIKDIYLSGVNAQTNKNMANLTLKLNLRGESSVVEIINKLSAIDGVLSVFRK